MSYIDDIRDRPGREILAKASPGQLEGIPLPSAQRASPASIEDRLSNELTTTEHRGEIEDFATSVKEARDASSNDPPPLHYLVTEELSNELKELFREIDEFGAERLEIPIVLKPFLLDYIPAVGDVDPFIKIPRIDDVRL